MAQLFVGQTGLLRAEEQCDAATVCELAADAGRGLSKLMQRMLEHSLTHGGGAQHERAVGDSFGDARELRRAFEHARGIDGGLGRGKRNRKWIGDAQAGKAEVVHGAGHGADVGGVARADEHDGKAVLLFGIHKAYVTGAAEKRNGRSISPGRPLACL